MIIMESVLEEYEGYLQDKKRSRAVVEKHLRDVRKSMRHLAGDTKLDKNRVRGCKQWLRERHTITSTNSILAAVNNFLVFLGREELRARLYRARRVLYSRPERELTESDYKRLIYAARREGGMRMSIPLRVICSAEIRTSELRYIIVESLRTDRVKIYNKGRPRLVLLLTEPVRMPKCYCGKMNLHAGNTFITRTGRTLGRSNINKRMGRIGETVGVGTTKAFPHNLHHLFTRTFYNMEKDVVRLMDLPGHSNINTTRVYTVTAKELPRQQMARMHLVLG